MKIALVHDWLVYPGGAEKVFKEIIEDIERFQRDYGGFTRGFSDDKEKSRNDEDGYYLRKDVLNKFGFSGKMEAKVFTSFLNLNFSLNFNLDVESVIKSKNIAKYYRNLLPIFPLIQKQLSRKIQAWNPDLVVISSFAIAKNLDVDKPKILYLHSPMQYIWSHYDEYLSKFSGIKKQIFKLSAKYLRKWDKKYTDFDYVVANSNYTKKLAKEIYNIDVDKVVFPKVEIPNYRKIDVFNKFGLKESYYLYIGRLVRLVKHLDKIIEIFNKKPNKQLVIVGDGPDKEYLQKIAGENIKFLGYISSETDDYWNLIENAKAVINLTKESFGIVNHQVTKLGKTLISINDGAIDDVKGKKILLDSLEGLEGVI